MILNTDLLKCFFMFLPGHIYIASTYNKRPTFYVDLLIALDQRIEKMVLVLIGVLEIGSSEQMKFLRPIASQLLG